MKAFFVKPGKAKTLFFLSESLLERKIKKRFCFCVFFFSSRGKRNLRKTEGANLYSARSGEDTDEKKAGYLIKHFIKKQKQKQIVLYITGIFIYMYTAKTIFYWFYICIQIYHLTFNTSFSTGIY